MKKKPLDGKARLGLAILTVLLACCMLRGQDVKTNYMPGTDFFKYHTYKWVAIPGRGAPDEILEAQIKQAIDAQLSAKGLTKVEGDKADLLVGYQVGVTKEREWNAYRTGFGFPGGLDSATATSSTVNVGTLVLDIYDPAARQLVWTGTASKSIDSSKDPHKIQKNLNKAMQKLLKDFPPRQK
jgi:hypothetical protein